ncbi:prepilin peptidase [Microbacterium sp. NPDC064584]|uniref:prepilin peptidase n=1 Tax=Microbacterium sp. NPDC064584 TaxID=3155817 RepID=UPI0034278B4F
MTSLTPVLAIVAGLLGLAVGSFLNLVAVRVPAGIPVIQGGRCPRCGSAIAARYRAPVLGRLMVRGRCTHCGEPVPLRYPLVEAFTGVAFAAVVWFFLAVFTDTSWARMPVAVPLVLIAYLYFAAISIVLTLIDLDTHRLPNAIVLPSYPVAIGLLTLAALFSADWPALLRAGIGMAILYAFYFLLRLIRPGGMGGGDVKLAGIIGLYLGWIGWGALAVGAFFAFFYGGVFGIGLMIARRAGRKTAIPFGPWMILGAWSGIFVGEGIAAAYLRMYTGGQ